MLSELQRKKLPNLFAMYDANKDGAIDWSDFERFLESFASFRGWTPESAPYGELSRRLTARWHNIREAADTNEDGRISCEEWLAYCDRMMASDEMFENEATSIAGFVFGIFDVDGDGSISFSEYVQMYRAVGLPESSAAQLFERLGISKSDTVSRARYVELVEQFFKSEDSDAPGNWVFGPVG